MSRARITLDRDFTAGEVPRRLFGSFVEHMGRCAYTGIYDRPDLGRRDLRRLSTVLAGATRYELVLIDCPPSLNGLTRMAWSASDKVALVAEPGLFSVAGTERTMRAIQLFRQEFAPGLMPAGIVANRVRTGSAEHAFRLSEMDSMFGELLLTPHIPEQANWQQIQGAAHAVHSWPGDSAKNAAGLFDADGARVVVREDVGRHNAVDKAVGAVLLSGAATTMPPVLVLSGRIGFELVQKAVVSGIGVVVAVGAPSSLAVDLAAEAGLGLVGFTRPDRCVVYAGDHRLGV